MINAIGSKLGYIWHWQSEKKRVQLGCCSVCLMKQKSNSVRLKAADKVVYSP